MLRRVEAETHFGFLHSVAFALPSHVKTVCTVGKPGHAMLSLQAALCVRRSYETQLSESHCRASKCEELPSIG